MKTSVLAMILFATLMVSCKKESCPTPTYPIEGLWIGKYGNGATAPSSYYSFVIKPGGVVSVEGNNATTPDRAAGTWTLSGNTLNITYTYIAPASGTYSATATFSNTGTLTAGTWGNGASATGGGTWSMDRKN